ncbi:MAG: class F sortase [Chloroflexota bacterium]
MRRIGSGLLVVAVLFLIAASYPTGVAVGSAAQTAGVKESASSPAPAEPSSGQTASPRSGVDPSDGVEKSKEDASRILARLKPKADQVAARVREPAVELPTQIRIPAIGVDAGFEYVGLAGDGAMDVPKDGTNVAWYRLGPRPGETGNAVIAGHVDWGGKTAVFWELSRLRAGDLVEITAADGRKYEYVVQWQRWYEATQAPVQDVFGQSDAAEVTLITCGGTFDRRARQYLSRLVVRATLR